MIFVIALFIFSRSMHDTKTHIIPNTSWQEEAGDDSNCPWFWYTRTRFPEIVWTNGLVAFSSTPIQSTMLNIRAKPPVIAKCDPHPWIFAKTPLPDHPHLSWFWYTRTRFPEIVWTNGLVAFSSTPIQSTMRNIRSKPPVLVKCDPHPWIFVKPPSDMTN